MLASGGSILHDRSFENLIPCTLENHILVAERGSFQILSNNFARLYEGGIIQFRALDRKRTDKVLLNSN